jgi:pimeloyl-ACP methyl ester carboxylesterase
MNGAVVLMVRPPRLRRHLADRPPAVLPRIDVPTLMVHGTEDRILPIDSTPDDYPS